MLSVIVLCKMDQALDGTPGKADAVVRTLSALVSASVRGLVRDVVLAGPKFSGPREAGLSFIADHAGCACVEAADEADYLHAALELVRAEDLFILRPGYMPETGFIDAVEDLLAAGETRGGRLVRVAPETYWQRLLPVLAPVVGLIAPTDQCRRVVAGGKADFEGVIKATRSPAALGARVRRVGR